MFGVRNFMNKRQGGEGQVYDEDANGAFFL